MPGLFPDDKLPGDKFMAAAFGAGGFGLGDAVFRQLAGVAMAVSVYSRGFMEHPVYRHLR